MPAPDDPIAAAARPVQPGRPAPDFDLPGTGGRRYRLSEHRGAPVVLAFYPGDDTSVCTSQITSYNDDLAAFDARGAVLLGISPQGLASHEAFAARHGFRFPLLVDEDKAVGEAYGILGPLGFYRRSVFVVDAGGTVRWAHRSLTGLSYRKVDELTEVLDRL
jgi:peroxiredoxin